MNTSSDTDNFCPAARPFPDLTPWKLTVSFWRVFFRIRATQGLGSASRVIPVIWTIFVAVRGFARYHAREHKRLTAGPGGSPDQLALTAAENEEYRTLGSWLRDRLHNLGPAFIKIGQALSTRADLLPLPAMLELAKLQEEVKPYPAEIARQTIINALSAPPEELYASFNWQPLAAASLCQAYKATLHDGREVVVKVQRPNLPLILARDVQILEAIANELMRYPCLCRHTNWPGVVEEFARTTFEEIDYIREGRNADRFRHIFRLNTRICIPRIIWRLTGRRVLTIEYVPGIRVTDFPAMASMGVDRRQVTTDGANIYLRQLLEDGFFHADPHPGNIRIMPDGRVGLFDFGMVGVLSPQLKRSLVSAFLHVVNRQYRQLIDDFVDMGFLTADVDREALSADLTPIVEARFAEGITRLSFRKVLFDFSEIVWRYPFRLPSEFTYVMRALLTLEGVALTIDPSFNFIQTALPFAQRLMLKRSGKVLRRALLDYVFSEGRFNAHFAIKLFKAVHEVSSSGNSVTT